MQLEGRPMIEEDWAGRVTGLGRQHVAMAMMVTPDGHSRLELSRFLTPPAVADHRNAPVNALGYLRAMFTVDDIEATLARLRTRGAQLVGDVVQYEESYRLCYIRGPEGLLIGLAEPLGQGVLRMGAARTGRARWQTRRGRVFDEVTNNDEHVLDDPDTAHRSSPFASFHGRRHRRNLCVDE
jgi:catechol 2,3-dioxygenase-like lactoylglutathione lyase family enzyme